MTFSQARQIAHKKWENKTMTVLDLHICEAEALEIFKQHWYEKGFEDGRTALKLETLRAAAQAQQDRPPRGWGEYSENMEPFAQLNDEDRKQFAEHVKRIREDTFK